MDAASLTLNSNSAWLSFSGSFSILLGTSLFNKPIIGFLFYVAGLILLVLSISLFREDKELQSSQVAIIIKQKQVRDAQPNMDQPTILASFAIVFILLGTLFSYTASKIGIIILALGWIGMGFAGSMANNSLNSIQNERLEWTLSGSLFIVLGSLLFPSFDFGLIIASLGFLVFTIGNVQVR